MIKPNQYVNKGVRTEIILCDTHETRHYKSNGIISKLILI